MHISSPFIGDLSRGMHIIPVKGIVFHTSVALSKVIYLESYI